MANISLGYNNQIFYAVPSLTSAMLYMLHEYMYTKLKCIVNIVLQGNRAWLFMYIYMLA